MTGRGHALEPLLAEEFSDQKLKNAPVPMTFFCFPWLRCIEC